MSLPLLLHAPIWSFFFFNDTATTEIYTLSLHDALPIYRGLPLRYVVVVRHQVIVGIAAEHQMKHAAFSQNAAHTNVAALCLHQAAGQCQAKTRSEEHTSELQSHSDLVCRLLLEKKKKQR